MTEDRIPELPKDSDPAWQYYFIYWPGDALEAPRGVARRCMVDGVVVKDSTLGQDGKWRPTSAIAMNDLAMYDNELVRISTEVALDQIKIWGSLRSEDEELS
ncbi:MAG: hypothetical protein FWD18_11260 [Micrococcales bacterium]|nr:hypothetical protein [Micrococcales bacterium]